MYRELKTKQVICGKPHPCEWCGEKITRGETAISRAYLWEGEFNSAWQHPECFKAMEESGDDIADWGFDQGALDRGKTSLESACNK